MGGRATAEVLTMDEGRKEMAKGVVRFPNRCFSIDGNPCYDHCLEHYSLFFHHVLLAFCRVSLFVAFPLPAIHIYAGVFLFSVLLRLSSSYLSFLGTHDFLSLSDLLAAFVLYFHSFRSYSSLVLLILSFYFRIISLVLL